MTRCFIAVLILSAIMPVKAIANIKNPFLQKIITVTVDETGSVFIGRDALTSEQLADELQKRLWKSYMGTDKMYDAIRLQFKGEVPGNIKEGIKKAIYEAQQKALIDICLQKHKKKFEDLNSNQQEKIRNQFPVLFQKDY